MATRPSVSLMRPTKARYWVIVFAVTLAILSYIDRVAISQAAPVISRDLGLSATQMGSLFSAFAVAYALFEIPGGWMGDWMGARKVLMRIVIWWSAFTALTGYMWSYYSMYVCRFLFGAGEAGCFPNLTKAFSAWLPNQERTKAQGIMWMSARWGGALTPLLVAWTFQFMSWRTAFVVYGSIGVIWAAAFYYWYRDNPRDHKSVNEAELALLSGNEDLAEGHASPPWRKLLSSRTIWLLWAQYFFLSYPWYFYITWLPTFLRDRYPDLSDTNRAILAGFPLFFGGVGSLFSGFITSKVVRWTGTVTLARRVLGCMGFAGAAFMMASSTAVSDALVVMTLIGMASFFNDLVMPGAWATCMDVGGKYAGTVSGSMNMMGNLAGFVAPTIAGIMQDANMGWTVFLLSNAGMYFLGTLCWPWIDPVTPISNDVRH